MTNCFTWNQNWKPIILLEGYTADEFVTDGLQRFTIESAVHYELKCAGYERIYFYDRDYKLYCLDSRSFDLHDKKSMREVQEVKSSAVAKGQGLKFRGKTLFNSGSGKNQAEELDSKSQKWDIGQKSGVEIVHSGGESLRLKISSSEYAIRQIEGYLLNREIKTAVVITDTDDFLREFGDGAKHMFTVLEREPSENKNIAVCLYDDIHSGNFYQIRQPEKQNNDNVYTIKGANAAEIKNMLKYFYYVHNPHLKINIYELSETALALERAMSLSKPPLRLKQVYPCLCNFAETGRTLTPDECYNLLGVERPQSAKKQLEELIGMESVKKTLSEYEDTVEITPDDVIERYTASRFSPDKREDREEEEEMKHCLLTGNPGTGKTTVAKLIGQLFYEMGYLRTGHVVETDRSGLVGEHVGETAIKTRGKVMEAMGGVLFVDEAYSLKRNENSSADFGQEAIDTLVKAMDEFKGEFILVAAGYKDEMDTFLKSNPGLARRFRIKIHIDDYTAEELQKILELHASKAGYVLSDNLRSTIPRFCEKWMESKTEDWGNADEAVNLFESMRRMWKQDSFSETKAGEDGRELRVLESRHIPEKWQPFLPDKSEK